MKDRSDFSSATPSDSSDLPEISWEAFPYPEESVPGSDTSPSPAAGRKSASEKSSGTTKSPGRGRQSVRKQTVVNRKKTKTKKKRRSNVLRSTASTVGSAASGSAKSLWKLLILCAQWLCAGIMLFSSWRLFLGFWSARTSLGRISAILAERNYALGAFLCTAAVLISFGLLQTVWILSRKKMPDHGKIRRVDMGRGLFGFLFFLLLFFAAGKLNPLLPSSPSPLSGLKQSFHVLTSLGKSFPFLQAAGIILCILRKVGTR